MATMLLVTTLIVVFGLALEAVNGNGGGQGLAHALEVLKQGSPAEKIKALQLLARVADMQVMPALVQALRDDESQIRAAAESVMWIIWLRSGNEQIDALMAEGIRLIELEHYPEAAEIFDQITLELNPSHFGALSGMGLCYLGLEEPRQALGWFERAMAVNPNMTTIQSYIQQIREFLKNQTL